MHLTDPLPYFLILAAVEFALGFIAGRRFPLRRRRASRPVLFEYPRITRP